LGGDFTGISFTTLPSRPTTTMRPVTHSATSTLPSGRGWQECTSAFAGALYSHTTFLSIVTSAAPVI
jgi:hypothetical protein